MNAWWLALNSDTNSPVSFLDSTEISTIYIAKHLRCLYRAQVDYTSTDYRISYQVITYKKGDSSDPSIALSIQIYWHIHCSNSHYPMQCNSCEMPRTRLMFELTTSSNFRTFSFPLTFFSVISDGASSFIIQPLLEGLPMPDNLLYILTRLLVQKLYHLRISERSVSYRCFTNDLG